MARSEAVGRFVRLAGELEREARALERVAGEARDALGLFATRPPSRLEIRGAADLLHDFYTGAEKAFELIAVTVDGGVPEGAQWHRRLLTSMTADLGPLRPPVLRAETAAALDEYLRFRHLFRSLYGFELAWERFEPLLVGLDAVHALLAADLAAFRGLLTSIAAGPG